MLPGEAGNLYMNAFYFTSLNGAAKNDASQTDGNIHIIVLSTDAVSFV